MGLLWHEQDTIEEDETLKVHSASKRAALCSLVLTTVLLALAIIVPGRAEVGAVVRVGLWLVWIWAAIVSAYSVMTYWRARSYSKRRLSELGLTDPLTGLPNRKGLMATLEQYDLSAQEFGKRIRLVDVDLVNLDRVNYEFGQMVGDAVLQDIANVIRNNVPEPNLVGRLGGDEFLIIMPQADAAEAEELAGVVGDAIGDYRLGLGDRGEVRALKANVSVAAYVPEQASLHETVVSAKEATAHGRLPGMENAEGQAYYHVPRVTLGTFAVYRWQSVSKADQEDFKNWKRDLNDDFTNRMASELLKLTDEKAEANWVDFITAVPAPGGAGRAYPARQLAEALAAQLHVPYREVMRADSSGPETRSIEPAVDAVIDRGDAVLLVSDVISSGIVERRCVKKLAAAGAHVQVAAWAAY